MGPILLDLGCLPQVQSATMATTLFAMSTSTCLGFLVAGVVPVKCALWLSFATDAAAILGTVTIGYIAKKFRRPAEIDFLLDGIIATSALVMVSAGIIDILNDIRHGRDMLFKSLCSRRTDE